MRFFTDAKAELGLWLGSGARSAGSETSREAPNSQDRSLRSGNGLEGAAKTHTYHNAACDAGAWLSAGLAVDEARSKLPIPARSKILTGSNLLANASRRFIPSRNLSMPSPAQNTKHTYSHHTPVPEVERRRRAPQPRRRDGHR